MSLPVQHCYSCMDPIWMTCLADSLLFLGVGHFACPGTYGSLTIPLQQEMMHKLLQPPSQSHGLLARSAHQADRPDHL